MAHRHCEETSAAKLSRPTMLDCFAILAMTVLFPFYAHAEPVTTTMDTVVVTATRNATRSFDVPGMTTKVDAAAPGNAGASIVSDLLESVPGVEFSGSARRNGQNPSLRGYDSNGVLILFNGVRQNFRSGHDGTFYIDPSLLKSVEVTRGSNSTLYGNAALGGTIAFETVDAADLLEPGRKLGGSVTTGVDSVNDEWHSSLASYGTSEDWDVLAAASYRNGNNYRLGDGSTLLADDAITSGLLKSGYSGLENHKLGAELLTYDASAIEPNDPQAVGGEGVDKAITSVTTKLIDDYSADTSFNAKTQLYYTDTEVDEKVIDPTATNLAGDMLTRRLGTLGLNEDMQSRLGIHTLSYGLEAYHDTQDGDDSRNGRRGGVPDAEDAFYGAYLQNDIGLKDLLPGELTVTPGLRYDHYSSDSDDGFSNDEQAVSPKFAARWKPVRPLMFFGSYAEAFRAPTLTEIYSTGRHFTVGPFVNNFAANPSLKPETNRTAEFGFGLDFKNVVEDKDTLQFKASRFFTSAQDFIDSEITGSNISGACFSPSPPAGCSAGVTRSINVPSARLWGYEAESTYANGPLNLTLGAAFITGKNSISGLYLTNITPLKLTSNLAYTFARVDSTAGWKTTWASEHDNVNSAASTRPAYTMHDIYFSIIPEYYQNVSINFGIDNLFDEAYSRVFAGSLEPGRNFKAQMSIKF